MTTELYMRIWEEAVDSAAVAETEHILPSGSRRFRNGRQRHGHLTHHRLLLDPGCRLIGLASGASTVTGDAYVPPDRASQHLS